MQRASYYISNAESNAKRYLFTAASLLFHGDFTQRKISSLSTKTKSDIVKLMSQRFPKMSYLPNPALIPQQHSPGPHCSIWHNYTIFDSFSFKCLASHFSDFQFTFFQIFCWLIFLSPSFKYLHFLKCYHYFLFYTIPEWFFLSP